LFLRPREPFSEEEADHIALSVYRVDAEKFEGLPAPIRANLISDRHSPRRQLLRVIYAFLRARLVMALIDAHIIDTGTPDLRR
jgi:hypothetical protein